MKVVSRSVGCLRKIDFADALFRTKGVVPQTSVTFEDPGALGIACVSYHGPVHTFKRPIRPIMASAIGLAAPKRSG